MKLDLNLPALPRPDAFNAAEVRSSARQTAPVDPMGSTLLPPRNRPSGGVPFLAQYYAQEIEPAAIGTQAETTDVRWRQRDTAYRLAGSGLDLTRLRIDV